MGCKKTDYIEMRLGRQCSASLLESIHTGCLMPRGR